jgi:hypothetical protein
VVRALAFRPVRDHVPRQLYFLEGNLAILQSAYPSVNPFLVAASIFVAALSRGPHRMQAKFPPCPVALRARGATWECELEEVFRLRADALRRNWSRSVQPIYAAPPGLSTQATARLSARQNPRNWLAGITLKSPRRRLDRSARSTTRTVSISLAGPNATLRTVFFRPGLSSLSTGTPAGRSRPRAPRRAAGIRSEMQTAR